MGNTVKYTEKDIQITKILKGAADGMTLAEISEACGEKIQPGTITGLKRKGLIEVIGEREVEKVGKRNHTVYQLVSVEPTVNADGKEHNYTESEKAILAVLPSLGESFTLADIAVAMGKERLTSGNTNGLVKKGNILKTGEVRVVEAPYTSSVNVYGFVADVPANAVMK